MTPQPSDDPNLGRWRLAAHSRLSIGELALPKAVIRYRQQWNQGTCRSIPHEPKAKIGRAEERLTWSKQMLQR